VSSQVVKVTPGRLGAFLKANALRQHKAFEQGVKTAKLRGVALLKQRTPVDTGVMKSAWASTKFGIENDAPYAGIIERGARPHKVSREGREAIRKWVLRKGFVQHEVGPGGRRVGPGPGRQGPAQFIPKAGPAQMKPVSAKVYEQGKAGMMGHGELSDAVDMIVYKICSKLRKHGYKGKFFVEASLGELTAFLDEEIGEAMAKAIAGRDYFGRVV
jgi:hypothetical protein